MLELMIEVWRDDDEGDSFRWSLWLDGKRVGMGGPHAGAAESEAEAVALAERRLGRRPDRVTRL
jgi:hypothetical protein